MPQVARHLECVYVMLAVAEGECNVLREFGGEPSDSKREKLGGFGI